MSLPKFHGVAPALVTPMNTDGSVDFTGLKHLINHIQTGGVDYMVVNGTTAESVTTSSKEKKEILEFIKGYNPRNLPIVYGVGGNDTMKVIKQMKEIDFQGIDAILSVCPYYNKPSQRGVIAHYSAIADACNVPLIMYNIPGRTGINMNSDTTLKLAEHPNIIGIKEASCIIEQIMEIMRGKSDDFMVISGDDVQAVPIIANGGVGVMSVIANAIPAKFTEMIHAALLGNYKEANAHLKSFLAIDPLLYQEGNPVGIKTILSILGICHNQVRLPHLYASEELAAKIKATALADGLI